MRQLSTARSMVLRRHLPVGGSRRDLGLLVGRPTAHGTQQPDGPRDSADGFDHGRSKPALSGTLPDTSAGWNPRPLGSRQGDTIPLPDDFSDRRMTVEEAIERRRSVRAFHGPAVTLLQLSRLLHRASGITDPATGFRAAPSAGALYPLEIYTVANSVQGLLQGIYRYRPSDHSLETVRRGDFRGRVSLAALDQEVVARAYVVLVLAALFERSRSKYGERSYRYVLMECGHVGENVYLAATSMGLGACAVGAFMDDQINGLLGLGGRQEAALYLLCLGSP